MKLKALVFAFATALVMAGCDSSTSSDTEIQELPDSSDSSDLSSSSVKKDPNSSASKDDTGKTNGSASVADAIKDLDPKNLTPEQLEMISNFTGLTPEELKRLVEVFANADGANSNID
jgi:uncharacterized lipoprotein